MKNKLFVISILSVVLASCATTPSVKNNTPAEICFQIPDGISIADINKEDVSMPSLTRAAAKEDVDYIKQSLSGKKFTVQCPSAFSALLESPQDDSQRNFAAHQVQTLMSAAVEKSKFTCDTKITDILIASGAMFSPQNVADLAVRGCEKQISSGLVQMNSDSRFRDAVYEKFVKAYKKDQYPQVGYALGAFEGMAERFCKAGEKNSCDAAENFKKILTDVIAKEEVAKKENRKAEALRKADRNYDTYPELCPTYFEIRYAEKSIKKERDAGKISGFVDSSKLHQLGSQILAQKRQLKILENENGIKNGKGFPYNKCPKDYDNWSGVSE